MQSKIIKAVRKSAGGATSRSARSKALSQAVAADSQAPPEAPARPPSRRERAAEAKRDQILAAALDVFSRRGLEGASVESIAEKADVSKTNLLYYYRSKDELYVAVLEQVLGLWMEPLRSLKAEDDPIEAIGALIDVKLGFSRSHPEASRLFCMEVMQGAPLVKRVLEGPLRELVRTISEIIASWSAEGRLAQVDPVHLIFAIWAVTQHYADFAVQVRAITGKWLDDPGFVSQARANVAKIILDGVRPRAPA